MYPANFKVIIVGAGPSGLLLGVLLAKNGIPVTIVEATETLDNQPRATHYGSPAMHELRRAGIVEDLLQEGFQPGIICWRKLDGTYLAGVDNNDLGDYPDRGGCLPLNRLGQLLLRRLKDLPTAEIKWNHRVTGIGQDETRAWVNVSSAAGETTMGADYIVGCDGANSQIRRSLFGDTNFPGKTWDVQLVATNVYYNFEDYSYEDANFIIDPVHWHMASRISRDGMWRVTYGEQPGFSREELKVRLPLKFELMLPGHPKPDRYKLANFSPYRVHQRLAEKMRVGRFLLAADAAHLCNPFGGLGLTGGIVDVGGLSDCLNGIWTGQADPSILDLYDQVRRQKYKEIVDQISSSNLLRMFTNPETILEPGQDEFLTMCLKAEKDKKLAREMQLWVNKLQYDFTLHYSTANTPKYSI